MQSKAATPAEYVKSLPEDRRKAINALRKVIKANLGKGFKETMEYGMIHYVIPHSIYPDGYHCDPKRPLPFIGLASQKNKISLYLMCVYSVPGEVEWFTQAWKATGKKLDMGKSCVRFKTLEDAALDVIGESVSRVSMREFIDHYESVIKPGGMRKAAANKKPVKKKATSKKAAARKPAAKKKASKKKAAKTTATRKPAAKKKAAAKKPAAKKKAARKVAKKTTARRKKA